MGDTEEVMAAAALSRRQATQERERPCPCCGEVRSRPISCTRCGQIAYCGQDCLVKDSARHRTFCGISLKDMFSPTCLLLGKPLFLHWNQSERLSVLFSLDDNFK